MKKFLLYIFAVTMAISLAAPFASVYAQADAELQESITLSPVSRKYNFKAGEVKRDSLTIINDGKTPYDFIVYSRPYSVNNESYEPNFTKTPVNADAYSWVQFDKTNYHLEAGESTKIEYTIRVPERAAPGGHYGVIFAETQPPKNQNEGNSVIRKKRVGSLIYATVDGKVINEGKVGGTTIPFWQLQPPLVAYAQVANTGNTDFTNDTVFTVKDIFGNTKFQQTKQYTVLPNAPRKIPFEWPEATWFGLYNVEVKQTVLGQSSTSSGYVLILPRYIPILFVVFVLIGGGYAWYKRRKK